MKVSLWVKTGSRDRVEDRLAGIALRSIPACVLLFLGMAARTSVAAADSVKTFNIERQTVGQPVKVTTENLPGRHFDGKVTRFRYALEAASRIMLAEVMLDNPDLSLRPGMLVTARMGIEHKDSAPLMPVESLVMEKANAFAYPADGGKAVKHPIKTGFNDGQNVEVLEGLPSRGMPSGCKPGAAPATGSDPRPAAAAARLRPACKNTAS
jgi:multidrug efflux pump subunit AcrA (membrane-fusion protein)